jgi:hypothetical protein
MLLPRYQNIAWLVQVPVWSSCGGSPDYKGVLTAADLSVCCPLETTCRKYNDFFWQCMPDDIEPQPEVNVTYAATCTTSTKVRAWLTTDTWPACLNIHEMRME